MNNTQQLVIRLAALAEVTQERQLVHQPSSHILHAEALLNTVHQHAEAAV